MAADVSSGQHWRLCGAHGERRRRLARLASIRLVHILVVLKKLAQKGNPMKPIVDLMVPLVDAVARVESRYGGRRRGHIATSALVLVGRHLNGLRWPAGGAARCAPM